ESGQILLATEQGKIFECRTTPSGAVQVRSLLNAPLESADRDSPGPLAITSIAVINGKTIAGSLSRGLLTIEDGNVTETQSKPAGFFIRALAIDATGKLWVGSRSRKNEPGVFSGEPVGLKRNEEPSGPVLTIQPIGDAIFVGTDGRGVLRFEKDKTEHFTFDGTAGGLRSDRVYAIFPDR